MEEVNEQGGLYRTPNRYPPCLIHWVRLLYRSMESPSFTAGRMSMMRSSPRRRDRLSGRLPDRLEDLRGPREGVVVLPVHLSWHGLREFDVAKDESRLVLYSILLGQGAAATWPGSSTRGGSPRTGRTWPHCSASESGGPVSAGWACYVPGLRHA
jgi:hypothetical protein